MEQSLVLVGLGVIAVVVLALVWLVIRRINSAKNPFITVGLAAATVFLISASFIGYQVFAPQQAASAWVNGATGDDLFEFEFRHERVYRDGHQYVLATKKPWAEVAAELSRQFPAGLALTSDAWVLPDAATPVLVRPMPERAGEIEIVAQFLEVRNSGSGTFHTRIPFPVTLSEIQRGEIDVPIDSQLGLTEFQEFYAGLAGATVEENVFTVPGSNDRTVVITYQDSQVTISR